MIDEHRALAAQLLQTAVDHTESPARAASVLVTAAAILLARTMGPATALDLLTQGLDETAALLRAGGWSLPPQTTVN